MEKQKADFDEIWQSAKKEINRLPKRFVRKLFAPSIWKYAAKQGLRADWYESSDRYKDIPAQDVSKLFKEASRRRFSGFQGDIEGLAEIRKYSLEEVKLLRHEIWEIKAREVFTERFVAGGAAAIFLAFSKQIVTVNLVLFLPLFFSVFGFLRFREYQRNIFQIDCYMREIEYLFSDKGAWVGFFFEDRSMNRYFESRLWYWVCLMFASVGMLVAAYIFGFEGTPLTVVVNSE